MKRVLMTIVLLGITSAAWAQASSVTQQPAGSTTSRIFVGGVGGVTFGNVTSSTYGGEVGFKLGDSLEIFGEVGRMTDVTGSATADAAAAVGNYLNTLGKGAVTWTVESPANYGAAGVRYLFGSSRIQPYVAATVGVANVERNTTYMLNGTDATASLPSIGVQLGQDLAGKTNNLLVTAGGGVRIPFGAVLVDVGARYGRIFTDPGTDTFRIYAGVGFRF
jgi:hypothetical protein